MAVAPAKAESYEERWSQSSVIEALTLWEIPPSDQQKFFVLQKKVKDVQHPWNDPHVLLGFVEAFGMAAAEKKFRKMIEWRLQNNVDSLLKEYHPHPLLMDNSPVAFLENYDHDGDPIYVERGGACDAKGLLKRFSKDHLMKHSIWLREVQSDGAWLDEYKERQGRPVKDITVVYDLQGLCGRHLQPNVISFFQKLMDLTEEYYPGPVKRVIIIRGPPIFRHFWAVVKHFFSEESRQKMIFCNKDYLTELAKWMDISVLPKCINPNGTGKTARGMPKRLEGGKIPSHIAKGGTNYIPIDSGISGEDGLGESPKKATRGVVPSSPSASTVASSTGSLSDEDEQLQQREEDEIRRKFQNIGIEVSKLDESSSNFDVTVMANC